MKEALADMFSTQNYQNQSDGPDGGKAAIVLSLVDAYREAAKGEMFKSNPELLKQLQQKMIQRGAALQPPSQASGARGNAPIGISP